MTGPPNCRVSNVCLKKKYRVFELSETRVRRCDASRGVSQRLNRIYRVRSEFGTTRGQEDNTKLIFR
jgi:hypothetical protein